MNKLLISSFLGFILVFTSCKKDVADNVGHVNIKFSTDTHQTIDENVTSDRTYFMKNSFYNGDTVYLIEFANYNLMNLNDCKVGSWDVKIHIPKKLYKSNGVYMLGDLQVNNWIEIDKVIGKDGVLFNLLGLYSYSVEQESSFELYNETDNSINIKFSNVKVNNNSLNISAIVSCDLKIRKIN
jgi:hypothetical protein